eukprot:TRINITY_DN211_c0_g1_i1.p1 TRINITY_DN211_c0_g1~~TRINITY_DN211_c0_g1_i1.p1  ORF type:complete len:341 (-),score=54.16 TRINITY_DN211_c0_g1_i1:223-1245(-)
MEFYVVAGAVLAGGIAAVWHWHYVSAQNDEHIRDHNQRRAREEARRRCARQEELELERTTERARTLRIREEEEAREPERRTEQAPTVGTVVVGAVLAVGLAAVWYYLSSLDAQNGERIGDQYQRRTEEEDEPRQCARQKEETRRQELDLDRLCAEDQHQDTISRHDHQQQQIQQQQHDDSTVLCSRRTLEHTAETRHTNPQQQPKEQPNKEKQKRQQKQQQKQQQQQQQQRRDTKHNAPPFPDAEGEWVPRLECDRSKSFGWFTCDSQHAGGRCGADWMSAHAFRDDFRQQCKNCDSWHFADTLWRSYENEADLGKGATKKPHLRDRCEGCQQGACLNSE